MIIIINSLFQPGNFSAGSTTAKDFSPFRELQGLEMYYIMNDHCIKQNTSSKHKKKKTYKTFNILNIKQ